MKQGRELIAVVLSRNTRTAREQAGLNQNELAEKCQVHHTTIFYIETAQRLPSLETLLMLSAALEISPGDLLRGVPRWCPPAADSPGHFLVEWSKANPTERHLGWE
jgi:transcriptional regulator with XRE-family HTH domain